MLEGEEREREKVMLKERERSRKKEWGSCWKKKTGRNTKKPFYLPCDFCLRLNPL